MLTAFIVIFVIALFLPIVLWGIRNFCRILANVEVEWISDYLKHIFIVCIAIAAVFMILLIMLGTKVI